MNGVGLTLGFGSAQRPGFVGLLDRLSVAPILALSTRRLTGVGPSGDPIATFRETGADAEASFADTGLPPRLDFAAVDAFVGGASGRWKTWHDQSGGPDAVQTTHAAQPLYVPGAGPDFDGVGQFMTVPHTPAQSFADGLTIALWMRPGAFDLGTIVNKSDSAAIGDGFRLATGAMEGIINFRLSVISINSSIVFSELEWQHVMCICSPSGVVSFYKNNINAGMGSTDAPSAILSTNPVQIGARFDGSAAFYTGQIDDLLIFPGVISPSDRATLYSTGAPV